MLSPLLLTPLAGFLLTIAIMLAVIRLFRRWKIHDFPERYGLRRPPLPYPAGIAAVCAFILIFPLMQAMDARSIGVMGAVVLLGIVCFIDDRTPLPPLLRLGVQFLAALLVFLTGDCTGGRICSVTNPLEPLTGIPYLELNAAVPLLGAAITIFWLLVTVNALNWFDGIPGQVTTLSTIGFTVIGLLSLSDRVNQPELAALSFMLAGIALACLLFDLPPPRVVMGDTGSMFFGLMLGILTIYAGGKVATAFLVLGVPLLDLIFVVLMRLRAGRSPFRGSMSGEHLHHRLLAKGWRPRAVIVLNAGIGSLFGVGALFLSTPGKAALAGVLLLVMSLLWIYSSPVKPNVDAGVTKHA